jgi:hypothetical protein
MRDTGAHYRCEYSRGAIGIAGGFCVHGIPVIEDISSGPNLSEPMKAMALECRRSVTSTDYWIGNAPGSPDFPLKVAALE